MKTIHILFLAAVAAAARAKSPNAPYGDADADGLDALQERLAGTNPTNACSSVPGRLDYDAPATANANLLNWELYDDGDGMPRAWEIVMGTDPALWDAERDPDDDGWTNYEEWIAGTNPRETASFPRPLMEIDWIYDGARSISAPLCVQVYSGRRNVTIDGSPMANSVVAPGGEPDAALRSASSVSGRRGIVSKWVGLDSVRNHVVGGLNRIVAWIDLNGNGVYDPPGDNQVLDPGEPMGLSLYNSVLAGPDSFTATVPLTDRLFGFPRISWEPSTNDWVTCYQVQIWNGASQYVLPATIGITVEAPRTFLHEGDFIEAGSPGLDLGPAPNDVFSYSVVANGGGREEQIASGTMRWNSRDVWDRQRRAMKAVAPVAESTVYGSLVEFQWEMDWRTEGVFFSVTNSATGKAVPGLDKLYVPFPVRHNKITDDDYYYTYIPQLENGRGIVPLPSGSYTYAITEHLRVNNWKADSVRGSFTINNDEDDSRLRAAIKGHVHYYGRLPSSYVPGKVVVQAYKVSNRARTSLSVGGNPIVRSSAGQDGSFELRGLGPGLYGVIGWVDADTNGVCDVNEPQGYGFLGRSACPIQPPDAYPPLVLAHGADYAACDLDDVHVVLRDRGLAESGTNMPVRTFPADVPAGCDWPNQSIFE